MPATNGSRDVVILVGGDEPTRLPSSLPRPATIIAADGGLALAPRLDLDVDLVVGDLDSVDPSLLEDAVARGVLVERHPADKDRTDLAIALDAACAEGPAAVTLVGGHGGRLDHQLANLLLLASAEYAPLELTAIMGPAVVTVIRDQREVRGRPGELLSLLPAHGPALGVTTHGLRFPLDGEALTAGSSRGVSNEFLDTTARISLTEGVLLAVQPDAMSDT